MNRRKFLKLAGGTGIVAGASITAGLYALGMGPEANLPWHIAGSTYEEPRLRALSWAILAPNPHNRQPWLIDMNNDLAMTLSVDLNRLLPHTDPYNRQIMIGLGCFCELLKQAAAEDNYHVDFQWFPRGVNDENSPLDQRPIAKIQFIKGAQPDPLFKQVLKRRSYKEVFDNSKELSNDILHQLKQVQTPEVNVHCDNSPLLVKKIRNETMQAMSIEMKTERVYLESANLFRIGSDEVKANPDGIDIDGHFMIALRHMGVVTHDNLTDMTSSAYKQGIDGVINTLDSSKGYMWLTTKGNSRMAQINSGISYIRMNLKATELGLRMHPVSQGLQEYSEMETRYETIHNTLNVKPNERVQMLTRLGYGNDIKASPRWPVSRCVIS